MAIPLIGYVVCSRAATARGQLSAGSDTVTLYAPYTDNPKGERYVLRYDNQGQGYWIPEAWVGDGKVISDIRSKIHQALYGADGMERDFEPKSIDDVPSTTQLVETLIAIAKNHVQAVRDAWRARVGDSERMNAEMSARRSFVGRLWHIYKPGWAFNAGINDEGLRTCEEELIAWLVDASTKLSQRDENAEAVAAVRAELKATGHAHEGRALGDLVDIAIDSERERHNRSLGKIAAALKVAWSEKHANSHGPAAYRTQESWRAYLVNVITDHWQPKPADPLQELEQVFSGVVGEDPKPLDTLATAALRAAYPAPNTGEDKTRRLHVLEECMRILVAPHSLEDYAMQRQGKPLPGEEN